MLAPPAQQPSLERVHQPPINGYKCDYLVAVTYLCVNHGYICTIIKVLGSYSGEICIGKLKTENDQVALSLHF